MRRRYFTLLALAACVPGERSKPVHADGRSDDTPDGHPRVASDPSEPPEFAGIAAAAEDDGTGPLAERVNALRAEHSEHGFTVVAQAPWVVIGDEAGAIVRQRAEQTIAWATTRLSEAYFSAPPAAIVEIWLFQNERTYMKGAKAIFDDTPDTPYGYYSPTHEALIMNIGSGGGTLVHEMVHPLIAANFPSCPTWFNEGLASLYEQSSERAGAIVGLTNWRLAGLQQAIAAGDVPSFEKLLGTSTRGFYDRDPGTNYGQARYLCYWLQEEGKLRAFYRDFVAAGDDDPTGIATLRRHVGTDDLAAFQRTWEAFVTGLRFDASSP